MLWTSPACDPLSRESHLFSSHLSSVFCLLPLALSLLPFAICLSVSLSLRPLRPLCLSPSSLSLSLSVSRSLVLSFSRSLVLSSSRPLVLSLSRSLVLSLFLSFSLSFSLSRSLSLSLFLSCSFSLALARSYAFFFKRSTHLRDVSRTTLWVRWMLPARGGL